MYAIILSSDVGSNQVICQLPTIAKTWNEVTSIIESSLEDLTEISKSQFIPFKKNEDQNGVSYLKFGSPSTVAEFVVTKVEFKK